MNARHQQFINEYLKCWVGSEAYKRVYPNSSDAAARVSAHELLTNPNIAEAIQKRIDENAMSADEVLARLADHARSDMGEFLSSDGDGITLDLEAMQEKKKTHLIKKATQTKRRRSFRDGSDEEETIFTLELHDAQAALVHLGRHHKLFVDRTEVTGKDGKAVQIEYVNDWRATGEN